MAQTYWSTLRVVMDAQIPLWPIDELVDWAAQPVQPEVIRRTPWASVVRWVGPGGVVWGKAMCPGFASEARPLP